MSDYKGLIESERKETYGQGLKWRLDFSVLLSMAVSFVSVQNGVCNFAAVFRWREGHIMVMSLF